MVGFPSVLIEQLREKPKVRAFRSAPRCACWDFRAVAARTQRRTSHSRTRCAPDDPALEEWVVGHELVSGFSADEHSGGPIRLFGEGTDFLQQTLLLEDRRRFGLPISAAIYHLMCV
jgi:hypothetical protein